jgi:DNA (cytosine-5)-methyltransferase 1
MEDGILSLVNKTAKRVEVSELLETSTKKETSQKVSLRSNALNEPVASDQITTFVDLFAGIGGFHVAAKHFGLKCVFASEIDEEAKKVYHQNFGLMPYGDITSVNMDQIPDHDLLCAGFPCQPFSIIGKRDGFDDARDFLFFEVAKVVAEKRPKLVMLENVKQLATASDGKILTCIISTLEALGYSVIWKVLNALDHGLPQKRERILILASRDSLDKFKWPQKIPTPSLKNILDSSPHPKHFVSDRIKRSRKRKHTPSVSPAIWHENKSGNISSHPFSCALRAGASYNYLLVDGERRLTPREMFRLQGFPEEFILSNSDTQARKQAGNAVPITMIQSVMGELINVSLQTEAEGKNLGSQRAMASR